MAKYCKICGSKLEETTGICPNCNPSKVKNKESRLKLSAGRKQWSFFSKLVLWLLLLVVIAGGIAGTLVYFGIIDIPYVSRKEDEEGQQPELNAVYSEFKNISGTCVTRKIDSEEDALAVINDLSEILGVENADDELGNCKTDNVLNNSYYRFEQKYKDIPVYGRSMVVSADQDGKCLMITGNYVSVKNVDTQIKFDEKSAKKQLQDQYGADAKISNGGLTIYSLNEKSPEQAWDFYISNFGVTRNVLVSTVSGSVLAEYEQTYAEKAECSGKDVNNRERTFSAEKKEGIYYMHDASRGINVYDANNSTLEQEVAVIDSNGSVYYYKVDDEKWVDASGKTVKINTEDENFSIIIRDESGRQIGEKGEYAIHLTTKNIFTDIGHVTSKKGVWLNKKAVTLMADISSIYDFWQEVFKRDSFDGENGEIVAVYDDYKEGDTANAGSSGIYDFPIAILSFGTDNSLAADVIGHEYMHSVERSISDMLYEGESGALKEAYADIFGEISQDWIDDGKLNNSCDWIFDSGSKKARNMINPTSISYPDTYKGGHWADTSDVSAANDRGGVHTNNTVISHAAYLMWTGIENNPSFEALDTSKLAKLFYVTLLSLPSDCTFAQFRSVLQNTANVLCEQGVLTYKQRCCVSNAMFQAGIEAGNVIYTVSGNFELCVYDLENKLYDDYSVSVAELDLASMLHGLGIEASRKNAVQYQVQSSEPYKISLKQGVFEIVLTDDKNNKNTYRFYLMVVSDGKKSVSINTAFGVSPEVNMGNKESEEFSEKVYASYKAVVEKKENEYGMLCVSEDATGMQYLDRVSYLDLVDFDQDGTEELVLYYVKEKICDGYPQYCFEIYQYNQEKQVAELVLSEADCAYTNDSLYYVSFVHVQNKPYLKVIPGDFAYRFYGADDNKKIKKVMELTCDFGTDSLKYYQNAIEITEADYHEVVDVWDSAENSEYYELSTYAAEGLNNTVSKINDIRKKLGLETIAPSIENADTNVDQSAVQTLPTDPPENKLSEGKYEYTNGAYLSSFRISEMDGKKTAELGFWQNYGNSPSDEDFFFDWEDGKWEYTVMGNRSRKQFILKFEPTVEGLRITVRCAEGTYYTWETAQESEEWISAIYKKVMP